MYVCLCKGLTESDIQRAAQTCKLAPESLAARLGLEDEDCCGRCVRNIHQLIATTSDCGVADGDLANTRSTRLTTR